MCHLHVPPNNDCLFLVRFSLADDAREIYEFAMPTKPLLHFYALSSKFITRYPSSTNQEKTIPRTYSLSINNCRTAEDDEDTALEYVVLRINRLPHLALTRDKDDAAKIRVLREAVVSRN